MEFVIMNSVENTLKLINDLFKYYLMSFSIETFCVQSAILVQP